MIRTLRLKLLFSITVLLAFTASVYAQTSTEEYYQSATGKTGGELKTALYYIIKDNVVIPYTTKTEGDDYNVWEALKITDEDPNDTNNVLLIYTRRSELKSNTDGGSGGDLWNREHIWAKSYGLGSPYDDPGAATDIHALRACDGSVNSARGNKFFDVGGSAHSEATSCNFDNDSWEPGDDIKGDIARTIFYMAVRYKGENGEPNLHLTDDMNDYQSGYAVHGKYSTLLDWNNEDPVDDAERTRNEKVYEIQGNRNPFIDHPEWVDAVWETTDSNSPVVTNYSPEKGDETVSLTANLKLSFNEEIAEGTGSVVIKRYSDDSEFESLNVVNNPRVTITNNTVLVNPEAKFEEGVKYYVSVASGVFTDASSNTFDGISNKEDWYFTTGFTPPSIVEFSPENESTNVSIDTDLEITFDKDVQAGNGKIFIYTNGDEVLDMLASVAATFNGEQVTIELPESLEASTEYYVLIDEFAFVSENGAAFAGIDSDSEWTFTTEIITGIDDVFGAGKPSFYPNPATSEIRLINIENVESMHISNLTGRNIMEIKSPDTRISLNKIPKGMYFVTFIYSDGNRITKKLLKR